MSEHLPIVSTLDEKFDKQFKKIDNMINNSYLTVYNVNRENGEHTEDMKNYLSDVNKLVGEVLQKKIKTDEKMYDFQKELEILKSKFSYAIQKMDNYLSDVNLKYAGNLNIQKKNARKNIIDNTKKLYITQLKEIEDLLDQLKPVQRKTLQQRTATILGGKKKTTSTAPDSWHVEEITSTHSPDASHSVEQDTALSSFSKQVDRRDLYRMPPDGSSVDHQKISQEQLDRLTRVAKNFSGVIMEDSASTSSPRSSSQGVEKKGDVGSPIDYSVTSSVKTEDPIRGKKGKEHFGSQRK